MSRALLALGVFVWIPVALESRVIQSPQAARPALFLPAESPGWEKTLDALLAAFDHADVVALGEAHGRQADVDLRIRLIRHPMFPQKVRYIVTEFGSPEDEALIDAVREVNRGLPSDRRMRVISAGLTGSDPRDRNAVAVSILREQVLQKNEKALVVFGAGHLWHGEGAITKSLQAIIPGRVFVVETLAPLVSGQRTSAHDELDRALASLEGTVSSSDRPIVLSWSGTAAGKLVANPFYLGQAFLRADTTLADLDDAVVLFETRAGAKSTAAVGQPPPVELQPGPLDLTAIYYEGSKQLKVPEIDARLRENGIRVRLDAPLDGATACVIKEVIRDLLSERGFADAEVTQRASLESVRGSTVKKVIFTIHDGERTRPNRSDQARSKIPPAARCNR